MPGVWTMSDGEILGVNRRTYKGPGWIETDIIVVLVAGHIGDYAAYIATGRNPEWCARHGDKLCFAEAQIHFCNGLQKEKYRE